MTDVLTEWERVLTARPRHPLARDLILRSWTRSRSAGLDPASGRLRLQRIPHRELRGRLEEREPLLRAATPHVETLSRETPVPHVAYVVDADGIVLLSVGTDSAQMHEYGLLPGYDWSEGAMGTNGAGTALVTGRPVAVFGEEHFLRPLKGFICTAAPVRDAEGRVIAALDLSVAVEDGRPDHLLRAIETAAAIERDLGTPGRAQ